MRIIHLMKWLLFSFSFLIFSQTLHAQRYLSEYDSTVFVRDTLRTFLKRMENLHFSGYIQPQYQVAGSKGADSYEGGSFSDSAANRFMIRRARIRMDYLLPSKNRRNPLAMFAFQFDVTERGVVARDVFLRLFEPASQRFSIAAGLLARPFGFEVNLSSSFRETPERGRMSQILMPSERDLGAMVTYESRNAGGKKPLIKWDIGVFNGQGLSASTDFDSYKDVISRLTLKPYALGNDFTISGGLSLLYGGWLQSTKYEYETVSSGNSKYFQVDSSEENVGNKAPRHYYGADVQLAKKHGWGKTEIRGEYWRGSQPGTASSTVNPGALPLTPTYIRNFDGAFIYFLQNIISNKWELMAKYDWYDPNTEARGLEVGATNLTEGDVRFSTLGFGLTHYLTDKLRVLAYYSRVKNEGTSLSKYANDLDDNVFTLRMHLRF